MQVIQQIKWITLGLAMHYRKKFSTYMIVCFMHDRISSVITQTQDRLAYDLSVWVRPPPGCPGLWLHPATNPTTGDGGPTVYGGCWGAVPGLSFCIISKVVGLLVDYASNSEKSSTARVWLINFAFGLWLQFPCLCNPRSYVRWANTIRQSLPPKHCGSCRQRKNSK